jgi:hypothetical protein
MCGPRTTQNININRCYSDLFLVKANQLVELALSGVRVFALTAAQRILQARNSVGNAETEWVRYPSIAR